MYLQLQLAIVIGVFVGTLGLTAYLEHKGWW